MSTSSSAAGAAPARESVREFVYRDSSRNPGGKATADILPAIGGEGFRSLDDVPRISEEEIARLTAEARAEGMREGQARAQQSFLQKLEEQGQRVSQALAAFQQEREGYYAKVEIKLVELALAIAGKILYREAQVDPMVVAGLVKVMLERMQQRSTATVRVRPDEASSWRHYFAATPDLTIVEDANLKPGECQLETELGTAEMGIDAQLKEVEAGFFDLLAQRPKST